MPEGPHRQRAQAAERTLHNALCTVRWRSHSAGRPSDDTIARASRMPYLHHGNHLGKMLCSALKVF